MNQDSFRAGLLEVLENKKYWNNAKKVKSVMTDTPMKSKELFLYWINYAIRHKGAEHLISDAVFEMNAFQYWSLDVIAFLLGVPLVLLIILVWVINSLCLRRNLSCLDRKKRR